MANIITFFRKARNSHKNFLHEIDIATVIEGAPQAELPLQGLAAEKLYVFSHSSHTKKEGKHRVVAPLLTQSDVKLFESSVNAQVSGVMGVFCAIGSIFVVFSLWQLISRDSMILLLVLAFVTLSVFAFTYSIRSLRDWWMVQAKVKETFDSRPKISVPKELLRKGWLNVLKDVAWIAASEMASEGADASGEEDIQLLWGAVDLAVSSKKDQRESKIEIQTLHKNDRPTCND